MGLNFEDLAGKMISAAAAQAGHDWSKIQQVAQVQFRTLAQGLVEIANAVADPDPATRIDQMTARQLAEMATTNAIATIAMLTQLVRSAIVHVVNAALAVVKTAINTAAKFTLL